MRTPAVPTPSGKQPETQITVLSNNPIADVDPATLIRHPGVIGDATEKGDPSKNELEPTVPTVYAEVLRPEDGRSFYIVNDGQGRCRLTVGKIVSSLQYDLKSLHRQGVKLKRVEKAQLEDPTDTSFLQ